jgi:hypothetical protein
VALYNRGGVGSNDKPSEMARIHGDVGERRLGTNRGVRGQFRTRRDKVEAMD